MTLARILVALSGAAALVLVFAAIAVAGDYYVYACSYYGNTAPAFQPYSSADHMSTPNECMQPAATGGYRSLELSNAGASAPVLRGYGANWTAYAPAGVTIVGAYTPINTVLVDCHLNSDGFSAQYYWANGAQEINYINDCNSSTGYGYGDGVNLTINPGSFFFAWGASCTLASSCATSSSVGAVVGVQGIRLTAQENTGPSIVATGNNAWYHAGHWIRGAGWSVGFTASDPSGVCGTQAVIGGQSGAADVTDYQPNTSVFTQCPGSVSPSGSLDTTSYPNGPLGLVLSAGNAAGVVSSPQTTVYIDNSPVTLAMGGPTSASSTAGVQYMTATVTGGPSGVSIACSIDGSAYRWYAGPTARLPVSGLGVHTARCYGQNGAVDPNGVPATSSVQSWSVDIRDPTVIGASFSRIADQLRCRKVGERVLVPAHWKVLVHRRNKIVKIRVPAHYKTVKVTRCHERTIRERVTVWKVVNRHGKKVKVKRTKTVRVSIPPHVVGHSSKHVAYGKATTVSGWLGLPNGTALGSQSVTILAAPNNGSGGYAPIATTTTSSDGSWSAVIPAGPSRLIEAAYSGGATIAPAVSAPVKTIVPAKVLLTVVRPRRTPWNSTIRIEGQVLGGYIPASSKLLRLDIGVNGLSAIQGIPNIAPNGDFSTTYTFNPGYGVVRFWFKVSTLAEADYAYAPGHSRRVTVSVGVPAPRRRRRRPTPRRDGRIA